MYQKYDLIGYKKRQVNSDWYDSKFDVFLLAQNHDVISFDDVIFNQLNNGLDVFMVIKSINKERRDSLLMIFDK